MPRVSIGEDDLHYSSNEAAPRDDGVAIVLVHGAGGADGDWPATWLSAPGPLDAYPVFAVDLPGHGRSDGNGHDTVDAYADAVGRFLDALKLDRVLLAGHSMGSAIALSLAVRRHLRLAGIAPIAGASRLPVSDAILDGLRNAFEPTVDNIVKYSWHRDTDAAVKQPGRQRLLDGGPDILYGDFLACDRFDVTDRLSDIDIPVLVVAADKDRMVRQEQSRALADAIPDAHFVSVDDCGHNLQMEKPDEVGRILSDFAREQL